MVKFQTIFYWDTGSAINEKHIYPVVTKLSLFFFPSQKKLHVPCVMFPYYQGWTWRVCLTLTLLLITKFYRKRVIFLSISFSWDLGIKELNDSRSKCRGTKGKKRFLRLKLLLCWRNTIQSVTQILYKTWFIFLSDENMPVDAEKCTLGYQDIVSTVIVEKLKFRVLFIMKPFSKVTTDWLLKFWWWKCDA